MKIPPYGIQWHGDKATVTWKRFELHQPNERDETMPPKHATEIIAAELEMEISRDDGQKDRANLRSIYE